MKQPKKDYMNELVDLTSRHLEPFIALLLKCLPDELGHFGTTNGVNVAGENYRYQFVVAKEGHPHYREMEPEDEV